MNYRIGIIGGGAAGMMVAATLVEQSDVEVVLFERNKRLGQKVMISGGGRCNVTTGFEDLKFVLKQYPRGEKFLRNAMYNFPPNKLIEWIEKRGVDLKCENDMRVFPVSDTGEDFVKMYERVLDNGGCQVLYESIVVDVEKLEEGFRVSLKNGEDFIVDKLVVSCGGRAYRHTGSVGDGYTFAEQLGHTITDLAPSLNSYMCKESWYSDLAGVSFKEVGFKFLGSEGRFDFSGPMIFTHKGISGPAVFALSSLAAFEEVGSDDNEKKILLDFCVDLSEEDLRFGFADFVKSNPKKQVFAWLKQYVPKRLANLMLNITEIDYGKIVSELGKKQKNKLISLLKNFEVVSVKKTPGDEFVTAGGVCLKEVNKKTMESKICPGLYFAGEVLNVDGFTGGFNLQAAWCTGRLAGESIVASLKD